VRICHHFGARARVLGGRTRLRYRATQIGFYQHRAVSVRPSDVQSTAESPSSVAPAAPRLIAAAKTIFDDAVALPPNAGRCPPPEYHPLAVAEISLFVIPQ